MIWASTFEKAIGGGHRSGFPASVLYFMRKDNSQSVFELIEKAQYDVAYQQYRAEFKARLSEKAAEPEVSHAV
jgi:hypothetical protein